MSVKLAGAIALALCWATPVASAQASLAPPSLIQPSKWVYYPYVEQVVCDNTFGTAVRIGPDRLLSVHHVTSAKGCTIDDEPITVEYTSPELDFSIVRSAKRGRDFVKYSCAGIRAGEWVHAIGHARGFPRQQMISLVSQGFHYHVDGTAILHGAGTVIPGQSGGATINGAGELVAMINAYNPWAKVSFVREIKDTPLCHS
jgi:hypothetical protein